jgi:hypothetical protein
MKTSELLMYREITAALILGFHLTAASSNNHREHTNKCFGQNAEILNITACSTCWYHWTFKCLNFATSSALVLYIIIIDILYINPINAITFNFPECM